MKKRHKPDPSVYQARRVSDREAEITIFDEIGDSMFGGISADRVDKDLKEIGDVDEILVRINSPGGSAFDALAMHTMLGLNRANIRVQIEGVAASAASIVAMAGNQIAIAESGFIMIHRPFMMAAGDSDDFRKAADTLEKIEGSVNKIYSDRTGLELEEIEQMIGEETWMNSAEAIYKGFADEVLENLKVAAHIDADAIRRFKFRHTPEAIADAGKRESSERTARYSQQIAARAAAIRKYREAS